MFEVQSEGSLSKTATNTRLDDQFTTCEDYALKARKPYTITKQREKWTQEEHKKFLQALKLYGRAWRRIEEHVGNKTVVQIRSHAQKFFTKVVRESSSVDGTEVESIEIPPPRAKRKPTRPYPRKVSVPSKKGARLARSTSPYLSGSNHENQSLTSVLSEGGADLCLLKVGSLLDKNGSSHSAQENDDSSPMNFQKHGEKTSSNDSSPESVSTQSLKLFGKTVFVTVSTRPSSPDTITTLPWNSMPTQAPECPPTMLCWSVYEDLAYPSLQSSDGVELTTQGHSHDCKNRAKETQKGSLLACQSGRVRAENEHGVFGSKGDKYAKGFVPYKRCLAEKNPYSFMLTGEEREDLRVRLCL